MRSTCEAAACETLHRTRGRGLVLPLCFSRHLMRQAPCVSLEHGRAGGLPARALREPQRTPRAVPPYLMTKLFSLLMASPYLLPSSSNLLK